ncbi:hypothetical protein IVB27_32475 [Bradyrhizobium sp. 197]|uniref:right-handed parallel beta-helix repeat-containing protein n=1 Tax=Bradyrhizobium sp. 197 TaxID=2782663 RepID=UPI001FFA10AE|nr:right-handed parallel beta-helix repeat-containing protein [Bradyrhizobium sp. 197]MCK1479331.1 hypothetical protein [Bradyrhizobium sp. 197]
MTIIDRRYSVAEGTAVKAPCLVATTANITLSGLQLIDGVTVAENDRVLVWQQTTGTENGIYAASSGNWLRTKDFDGAYDIVHGTRVFVTGGSTLAGNEYYISTSDPITIGSSSIAFTQMPASGIAASVAAAAASASDAATSASSATASAASAAISAASFLLSLPFAHGIVGDGTTDDRAAIQATIDAVAAAGGGYVHAAAGKTYRVVIDSGVTDLGLIIKSNVTLIMNGATINLECTGSVYGIRLQSYAHILGPGTIKTTVSASPGSQSVWHAPVSLGAAYGEVTSVGSLGNYINATRWSVRNVKLDNLRSGGCCIAGIGGFSHGVIEDIEYPDSSAIIGCVNFDWGTVGSINSADVAASRILYDLGTAYTVHPNNIDVRRLKIGDMTNASSCPIRLSGVHAIRVDGFEIAGSKAYGVFHTAGDLGYEFAIDNNARRQRHRGIVVKNGSILNANNGQAIYCDAYADNIALAVAGGYSPYLAAENTTDIVFENIRSLGSITAAAGDGVTARYLEGGTFRSCYMVGHQRGIVCAESSKRVLITGGEINLCYQEGIYIGAGTVPEEITVEGVWCYSNCVGSTSAGIYVQAGLRHTVTRCRLGGVGESFQSYGVQVDAGCADVEVTFNHVIGHKAPGAGYLMGTATAYGCVRLCTGNTVNTTYTGTPYSGLNIIIHSYRLNSGGVATKECLAARSTLTGDTTPTGGTWTAGDRIVFSNPVAGGKEATICTNGGAPGTWKQYGAINP